jgi:hypothetical protein
MKYSRRLEEIVNPDFYEEKYSRSRYCFWDDDGSSGDDYGSDGFAGDNDAGVDGGFASEGGDFGGGFSFGTEGGADAMGGGLGFDATAGATAAANAASDAAVGGFGFSTDFSADVDAMGDFGFPGFQATMDITNALANTDDVFADWDVYENYSFLSDQEAQAMQDFFNTGQLGMVYDDDVGIIDSIVDNVQEALGIKSQAVYDANTGRLGQFTQSPIATVASMFSPPGVSVKAGTTTWGDGTTTAMGELSFGIGDASLSTGLVETTQTETYTSDTANGESDYRTGTEDYEKTVASASGKSTSLLKSFMSSSNPSINPFMYFNPNDNPFQYFPTNTGRYNMADGGVASEMNDMLSAPMPTGVDPVAVKNNPESFLKDPSKAQNAQELDAIYQYNRGILQMAGNPIKAQTGMQVGEQQAQPANGPTGFIERPPEQVTDGKSVADDIPLDVPEGTYILNAAAVKFAGSEDIKKMILDAAKVAKERGIDISMDGNTIEDEASVSLAVSEGEVAISPILAEIIGYDKLEKINNRGKKATEEKIAEHGQEDAIGTQAAEGGKQSNVADTEVIDVYRSIIAQGGDPGKFEVFEEAFQAYQKGRVYRPMQSDVGTPEFDAEVRSKYGYAFPETKEGMLEESTYVRDTSQEPRVESFVEKTPAP